MSSCGRRRGEKDRVGKGEKRKYTRVYQEGRRVSQVRSGGNDRVVMEKRGNGMAGHGERRE